MLKGTLRVEVPMPPPQGDNDNAAWDDFNSTPYGVDIAGTDFRPLPGETNVFTASAPEQYKLTITATVLPSGKVALAYSRFVQESENDLSVA